MNSEPETLEQLVARARSCRQCRDTLARTPIPHEPNPLFRVSETARICIASQAPGIRAHDAGLPFADPSGERLRAWMGVTREEFYDAARVAILPMGFCFPGLNASGSDLPPRRECAPTWRARFFARLPLIDLVLCVGRHAQAYHLGGYERSSLTDTVKDWRRILAGSESPAKLPLPHPSWRNSAWLRRNPWFEADLVPVLQAEVRRRLD
jgi:uracil-DNA glycosylase